MKCSCIVAYELMIMKSYMNSYYEFIYEYELRCEFLL